MSKLNRTLYKMLEKVKSTHYATIERGDDGTVIIKVSIRGGFEDWLFREFPETETAQAYLRAVGRIENNHRIEEKNWYRPENQELAWDFDAGASLFLDLYFPSARSVTEEQDDTSDNETANNNLSVTMPF